MDARNVPLLTAENPQRSGLSLIRRDAESGKPYLHVPVPPAEVLDKFLQAAQDLLGKLRA